MIKLIFIFTFYLMSFSITQASAQTQRYNELSSTDQERANSQLRQLRSFDSQRVFTDEESLLIPEVVRNFIESSDCETHNTREAEFPGLYDWAKDGVTSTNSTSLSCTATGSQASFKLCSAATIVCENESVGRLQRQNVTYVVPSNESCIGYNSQQAMLNAMRIGNMSGGVQGIAPTIEVW